MKNYGYIWNFENSVKTPEGIWAARVRKRSNNYLYKVKDLATEDTIHETHEARERERHTKPYAKLHY